MHTVLIVQCELITIGPLASLLIDGCSGCGLAEQQLSSSCAADAQ